MSKAYSTDKPLIKIGELAKASGLSVSTLKFYVKEGLIRPVKKTGRNMSWYDPESVQTVQVIRTLQKERYYPLSVIKRLLESPESDSVTDLALLDAIHKVDDETIGETVGLQEASRRTHLSTAQIRRLYDEALIGEEKIGSRYYFSSDDLKLCRLVRLRVEAGISFEQTVDSFACYAQSLEQAVKTDVESFIRDAVLSPDFTAKTGTQRIRVSDETLERFIVLKRKKYNRVYGSRYLELLYRFGDALNSAIVATCRLFQHLEQSEEARLVDLAITGEATGMTVLDECVRLYRSVAAAHHDSDIAKSIAGVVQSRDYFVSFDPNCSEAALVAHALRLSWLTLAPPLLACETPALNARCEMEAYLARSVPKKAKTLMIQLTQDLQQIGASL